MSYERLSDTKCRPGYKYGVYVSGNEFIFVSSPCETCRWLLSQGWALMEYVLYKYEKITVPPPTFNFKLDFKHAMEDVKIEEYNMSIFL